MKDELPPLLVDAQIENINAYSKETGNIEPTIGLVKSGLETVVCFF